MFDDWIVKCSISNRKIFLTIEPVCRQAGNATIQPFNHLSIYLCPMGEYSISDAIQQFLNKSRIKGDIQAMQIEDAWEMIMGKTIAGYTDKLQIIGDKLIITTHVAPLKQELIYQKDKIIQRVNEALGQRVVREVVIQ